MHSAFAATCSSCSARMTACRSLDMTCCDWTSTTDNTARNKLVIPFASHNVFGNTISNNLMPLAEGRCKLYNISYTVDCAWIAVPLERIPCSSWCGIQWQLVRVSFTGLLGSCSHCSALHHGCRCTKHSLAVGTSHCFSPFSCMQQWRQCSACGLMQNEP